jgi:hypothetical protein
MNGSGIRRASVQVQASTQTLRSANALREEVVKDEIKLRIDQLLSNYGAAVDQRDEERVKAQGARQQFEEAFRKAIVGVIVPAAQQIKAQIEPSWKCDIRNTANSVTIEIYHGDMESLAGGRPHVEFKTQDHSNSVYAYIASQGQVGGDDKEMVIKDITPDLVQAIFLKLMERLVQEGPPPGR